MWRLDDDLGWAQQAACKSSTWERAFADQFFSEGPARTAITSLCRQCPVRDTCLEWALTHDEKGVWAGTSEAQRQRMIGRAS